MKHLQTNRRLRVGDIVYVVDRPEMGKCTIVEILRNMNVGCYIRTFYRLTWQDMPLYPVDLFLFQELGEME